MIAAAVGFQCPDDVRAAARATRAPRTVFGGRITSGAARVTTTLLVLNVAVHLLGLLVPGLVGRFGQVAANPPPPLPAAVGVVTGEYHRLLTAAFLHANLFHLLTNMLALSSVGPPLEEALGRARFLALYLLSALGGSALSLALSRPDQYGVGASGAIFGLFGAFYVVVRRVGGDAGPVAALLAINLVITFAVPVIDWRAHLGGLVTGALLALAYAYAPRSKRTAVHVAAAVALTALIAAAVLLRVAALQS